MGNSQTHRIHPTAIVSAEAEIADDVVIGPYAVIEGPVKIGPECVIRPYAHLIGPLTLGRKNLIYSGAVLGERPQHLRYNDEATGVEIGEDNTFRENVTIHRATTESWTTKIGSHNFFMAGSHVAHDCVVGDHCIFANNGLLGGHCVVENSVYISGNSAVHQFCRVGRLAMLSGVSASSKDIPPFIIQQSFNNITGVNVIGMRRAGIPSAEINAVRKAFRVIFREELTLPLAMKKIEDELAEFSTIQELLTFLRSSQRGINAMRPRGTDLAA